jgi:hypothetical protein
MARRPTQQKPERPNLTVDQKRRCIERLRRCLADLEAFDPAKVQKRYGVPEVLALEATIDEALSAAFGHRTPGYQRYSRAATLDHGPHIARLGPDFGGRADYDALDAHEARQYFAEGKEQSIALLHQAIRALQEEIADEEHEQQPPSAPVVRATRTCSADKVFLDPTILPPLIAPRYQAYARART